jgi:sugar lactone lactonase YvrE
MAELETILSGRAFLEGPRWHDGALFVSDMHGGEVLRVTLDGSHEVVATVPQSPSGLGWLPDGRMLIVSMDDRRLVRLEPDGSLAEAADCSKVAPNEINDMIVDRHGHAFISQFGYDMHHGGKFKKAALLRVDPDGSVHEVADEMSIANGMIITCDERTLVVAESTGRVLTAFDLADDGSISNRRVWAELTDFPDGICLDAEDGVWISAPGGDRFVRVIEGGEVTDVIETPGRHAIACQLGGPDGRTLFCCTSPTLGNPDESRQVRGAKVEVTQVRVPGPPGRSRP